jgi:dipeptidyl aminopeptidase/acylaminoacyl peptidase
VQQGNGDIYTVNADGTGRERITADLDDEGSPDWSPDGRRIIYTRFSRSDFSYDIYAINADGSEVKRLTQLGDAGSPSWSPDGEKIAFTRNSTVTGIYLMDADGTDIKQVIPTTGDASRAKWSPDGRRLVFSQGTGACDDVFVVDVDGSDMHQLTFLPGCDSSPTWSPDGKKIAYTRVDETAGTWQIYVMNADGTGATPISTRRALVTPDWQPLPAGISLFTTTNDAYVVSSSPNGVFNRKTLSVRDTTADMDAYVKYNVVGLSGTVQNATLRLYTKDPGPDGGQVYATSPFYQGTTTQWLETGLKWQNAPAISGPPVATIGKTVANRWVEVDVTQAVIDGIANQNGRVSFAITNDSTNLVTYSSKEGARPPELVVVTAP